MADDDKKDAAPVGNATVNPNVTAETILRPDVDAGFPLPEGVFVDHYPGETQEEAASRRHNEYEEAAMAELRRRETKTRTTKKK